MTVSFPSEHALAERSTPEALKRQADNASGSLSIEKYSGVVPALLMILNQQRQIVYANDRVLSLLDLKDMAHVCGFRPGEAFRCSHAMASEQGCGTTAFCRTCGALQAILSAQRGQPDMRECRMTLEDGTALDLRVWTMPIEFNNESFTIFSVLDIRDEKRRRALERVFFHDIMNAAVGVRGLSELLKSASPDKIQRFQPMILELAEKLIEDIQAQRDLLDAENSRLAINPVHIQSAALVAQVIRMYSSLADAHKVGVVAADSIADVRFTSDVVLLRRVLGNLIKNAIEASRPGDTVTVEGQADAGEVVFSVHNPSVIPPDVQLQLFQRSFSTKGEGRGLGTYSVKLLTENYLKGRVSFKSAEGKGTVFTVRYPCGRNE